MSNRQEEVNRHKSQMLELEKEKNYDRILELIKEDSDLAKFVSNTTEEVKYKSILIKGVKVDILVINNRIFINKDSEKVFTEI